MFSSKIIGCGMLFILCLISASVAQDEIEDEIEDVEPSIDQEELFENVQELLRSIQSMLDPGNETVSENEKLSCRCGGLRCWCCHRVRIRVRRFRFNENCCLTVEYLRRNIGFRATLTCGRRIRFSKEISLRNPRPICIGVPGLGKIASVCIKLSNLHVHRNRVHGCATLLGHLLFMTVARIRLGCFNIHFLDEGAEPMSALEPPSFDASYWIPIQQDAAAMPVYEDDDMVMMENIGQPL